MTPWSSEHIVWLRDSGNTLTTSDGVAVTVLEFTPDLSNSEVMSKWGNHFRNHYCFDTEIDALRSGTGKSRKQFLEDLKFPTDARGFGPGIRAGDFGEILIADYLEYIADFWVPRTRYGNKIVRDESTKGSDVIGFKIFDENETVNDILAQIEVKAQFSGDKPNPRLQDAIDDSIRDEIRKAESLNAMKQRLYDKGKMDEVKKVSRFQNPEDKPYTTKYGAAALFSTGNYGKEVIENAVTKSHPHQKELFLLVFKGDEMMKVVHELYKIAANES